MRRIVVNVDGGSRGNPGPAAIAAVASDGEGQILTDRAETIGETTNNVAEYKALLLGIDLARELEAEEAEFIGDSELIVRQVRGEYKVKKADLKPLHAAALAALKELPKWSIRNVPRELNAEADALVNEALDAAAPR
jgi:ribonuclease HI